MRNFLICLILACAGWCQGQIIFSKGTSKYMDNKIFRSGNAGAFTDVNGDGYDDLVILDRATTLHVAVNQGRYALMDWFPGVQTTTALDYAVLVGDVDGDKKREIITAGIYNGVKTFKVGANSLQLSNLVANNFFCQGANLADIDGDGNIDFFGCNDEGPNATLITHNGKFVDTAMIDFSTIPVTDQSGNYGSEWVDVDGDGDLDLYISKCKFGVIDKTDPRRINQLFLNENGQFREAATERGLANNDQSWTSTFFDYDNDGDLDCFVINHDAAHKMYKNVGSGFFDEITNLTPNPYLSYAFQTIARDFDNDGWIDILVVGADKNALYRNLGNGKFSIQENPLGPVKANSCMVGDGNHDGFPDVYAMYSSGINSPGVHNDELWINQGNANNFLVVRLESLDDVDGTGSKIFAYSGDLVQQHQMKIGESYGVTNSTSINIGLGQKTKLDSLIVKWTDGSESRYYNLSAGAHYKIVQDGCLVAELKGEQNPMVLCGQNLTIQAQDNLSGYQWNTGQLTKTITVQNQGSYRFSALDADGCPVNSEIINVIRPYSGKILDLRDTVNYCDGIPLAISVIEGLEHINWNGIGGGLNYVVQNPGRIEVSAVNQCGLTLSDVVIVRALDPTIESVEGDTVRSGQTATISVETEYKVEWFNSIFATTPLATGSSLEVENILMSQSYYAEAIDRKVGKGFAIGKLTGQMNSPYSANNVNSGLIFSVYKDLMIKSFDVATDMPGIRRFIITDADSKIIFSKYVNLVAGWNKVELDASLEPGLLYRLTTDATVNQQNLGFSGPRLQRDNAQISFPYEQPGYLELITTLHGPSYYYYFYNIQVEADVTECRSERVKVDITLDPRTSVEEEDDLGGLMVFPNPGDGVFNLRLDNEEIREVSVFDVRGQMVLVDRGNGLNRVDLSGFVGGVYLVRVLGVGGRNYYRRVVLLAL